MPLPAAPRSLDGPSIADGLATGFVATLSILGIDLNLAFQPTTLLTQGPMVITMNAYLMQPEDGSPFVSTPEVLKLTEAFR